MKYYKYFIPFFLLLICCSINFFFIYRLNINIDKIRKQDTLIASEISNLENMKQNLEKIKRDKKYLNTLKGFVYEFSSKLDQNSYVLRFIFSLVNKYKIKLISYSFGHTTNKYHIPILFSTQKISIIIFAKNYKTFLSFVYDLEKNYPFIFIDNIKINKMGLGLKINLEINFLYKKMNTHEM